MCLGFMPEDEPTLDDVIQRLDRLDADMLKLTTRCSTSASFENCTDDVQNALLVKGEQAMAKQRFRICIDRNDDGTPVIKQITGNSEIEMADRIVEAILQSSRRDEFLRKCGIGMGDKSPAKAQIAFAEYAGRWVDNNLRINANSRSTYRKVLHSNLNPFFGTKLLSDISLDDVLTFLSGLAEDDYSKNTGNTCLSILRQVLQCAVTDGYVKINPAADPRVKNPCTRKTEREALTREQWADVVNQIGDKLTGNERMYMAIVAYTAMRRGEVLGLRYEDIDFANNEINVSRNVTYPDGYNPNVGLPKNKKVGSVPIAAGLLPFLKNCPKEGYVLHIGDDVEMPLNGNQFWAMWIRISKAIDLHGATSHVFRHTVCTMLANEGVDLKTISAIARHSSTTTTANVYIHANDAKKREAMQKLDVNVA